MRYFQKLAEGIDVSGLLHAVHRQPELWNQHKVRTFHERTAHREIDDIILRYNRFDAGDDFVEKVCSEIAVTNYPAFNALPQARKLIFALMATVEGEHLGRVFISKMRPGVMIPPHNDRIGPADEAFPDKMPPAVYYDRYHIALQSQPGVVFNASDEQVFMAPGEAWWFDNLAEHSVVNNSADDRIHLVADIRTYHNDYIPA